MLDRSDNNNNNNDKHEFVYYTSRKPSVKQAHHRTRHDSSNNKPKLGSKAFTAVNGSYSDGGGYGGRVSVLLCIVSVGSLYTHIAMYCSWPQIIVIIYYSTTEPAFSINLLDVIIFIR